MFKNLCVQSLINTILYFCFCIALGAISYFTLSYDLKELGCILGEVLEFEEEIFYFIFYIFSLTITYNLLKIKKTKLNRVLYIFLNVIIFTLMSEIFKCDGIEMFIGFSVLNLIFVFKEASDVLDKILGENKNNNFYKIVIFLLFIIAMALLKIAIK